MQVLDIWITAAKCVYLMCQSCVQAKSLVRPERHVDLPMHVLEAFTLQYVATVQIRHSVFIPLRSPKSCYPYLVA